MGEVRRWELAGLEDAAVTVASRSEVAAESCRVLVKGGEELDEGWDGRAADAVLEAAEGEKAHVTRLADGLEDLKEALERAHSALDPAVQSVRDRISEAEAAGLVVADVHVEPAPGRHGSDPDALRALVDQHVEAIGAALVTVRSLDEHYGREIDEIAARLHTAIPPEVDRSPIPGPDDSWPGRTLDAATGAATGAVAEGAQALANDLDPETRGRHSATPLPDDVGRAVSTGLRGLGRIAGPLGGGLTVYDGVKSHAEGSASASEAFIETTGALGGGALGGAAAGAIAGSFFGPAGAFIGAGIGAAVGTYYGRKAGEVVHEQFFDEHPEG